MRTRTLALLIALSTVVSAHPLTHRIDAPEGPATAGETVSVALVTLNRSDVATAWTPPPVLHGRLRVAGQSWDVQLRRTTPLDDGAARTVGARGFAEDEFVVTMPADARGTVVLEIEESWRARALIDVVAPSEGAPTAVVASSESTATEPQEVVTTSAIGPPAAATIRRTFADRFSEHLPVYFIYGDDDPVAKFQFSFKYRLFSENDGRSPVLNGLHFGYTQRSLWDLRGDSSPFYDSSYMPEVIFESLTPPRRDGNGWFHWLGYQVGLMHESNGRDGDNSRSLNIAYIRPGIAFGALDGWNLIVAPRIFTYGNELSNNPDIRDYRGNAELLVAFGKSDNWTLLAIGRGDFDKGSIELNFTYPVRFSWGDFASYFLVQYFSGYGESLLNYNERSSSLRAGVSFVR